MALIAPLDLETLLVNTFAGSTLIFIGIALLMIAFGASRFKMPLIVAGVITMLFSLMVVELASWLYIFIIIIGGLLVGYTFTRFQR